MEGETPALNQAKQKGTKGIYLFCLARRDSLPSIDAPGLDETSWLSHFTFKDVVAVLSQVTVEEWTGPTGEHNLQDLRWVGPRACRHEELIEQVMRYSPVFPARFGTLLSSLQGLEKVLDNHYHKIVSFLDHMTDKEEWGIKLLLDSSKAEEYLLASKPSSALPSSPGARYLLEQRLRAEVSKEVKSWAKRVGSAIAQALQNQTIDFRPRTVVARKEKERDTVFNWAFLVSKDANEDFLGHVESLSAENAERGLFLEASGPWPPYTFCPTLSEQ